MTAQEVHSAASNPPKSQQDEGSPWRQWEGGAVPPLSLCVYSCTCMYGSNTLTCGPQDGVEGVHVLPARGEVLPGDLKLVVQELPHSQGGAASQKVGSMRSHVVCDQG